MSVAAAVLVPGGPAGGEAQLSQHPRPSGQARR
ncbi:hypothetical protein HDA40_002035 [Hamadaea flava]|nr:hypothetical protein [Hamadaea flava]